VAITSLLCSSPLGLVVGLSGEVTLGANIKGEMFPSYLRGKVGDWILQH
jgi:hypothetical protein